MAELFFVTISLDGGLYVKYRTTKLSPNWSKISQIKSSGVVVRNRAYQTLDVPHLGRKGCRRKPEPPVRTLPVFRRTGSGPYRSPSAPDPGTP